MIIGKTRHKTRPRLAISVVDDLVEVNASNSFRLVGALKRERCD